MYENNCQSAQSISTVRSFLSRTSFLTMTITSAAFTLFFLFTTITSSFSKQKNDVLASLYYFFGDNSVMAVNLIVGTIVTILFLLLTLGLLMAYLGAIKNEDSKMLQGINIILGSLIYMVILASCMIIVAFTSISVTYYQATALNNDTNSYYSSYSSYSSSSYTFFLYILFGTGVMTLSIALIRLVLSIRRAANGKPLTTKGGVLTLIFSIYGASLTGISFIVSLCNLVMPYDYIKDNKMLEPAALLILMLSVITNAAMTVMLIDLSVLTSVYSSAVNRINKANSRNIYAQYATNLYNQNQNRTPYVNPVQKMPSPPAQPYTAQTHAQYMATVNASQPVQAQPNNIYSNSTESQDDSQTNSDGNDNQKLNLDK